MNRSWDEAYLWRTLCLDVERSYWECHFAMALRDPARSLAQEAIWTRALLLQSLREICQRREIARYRAGGWGKYVALRKLAWRLLAPRSAAVGATFLIDDSVQVGARLVKMRLLTTCPAESRVLGLHIRALYDLANAIVCEVPALRGVSTARRGVAAVAR